MCAGTSAFRLEGALVWGSLPEDSDRGDASQTVCFCFSLYLIVHIVHIINLLMLHRYKEKTARVEVVIWIFLTIFNWLLDAAIVDLCQRADTLFDCLLLSSSASLLSWHSLQTQASELKKCPDFLRWSVCFPFLTVKYDCSLRSVAEMRVMSKKVISRRRESCLTKGIIQLRQKRHELCWMKHGE